MINRLSEITRDLAELDAKRVPGVASLQNFEFLAALDKHWPTIRGMLNTHYAQNSLPPNEARNG